MSGAPAVTIRFEEDGSLSGSTGCSEYQSTYAVDGTTMQIAGGFTILQLGCPAMVLSRANAYGVALGRTTTFAFDGGALSLRNKNDVETATFESYHQQLAAHEWIVTAYDNGANAVLSPLDGSQITANFGDDGRLTGNAGCNNYFADYTVRDESIVMGTPGSTRRACAEPAGVMEQETLFLAALASAVEFHLSGDVVTLRRADGDVILTLGIAIPVAVDTEKAEEAPAQTIDLEPLAENVALQFDQRLAEIKVNNEDLSNLRARADSSESGSVAEIVIGGRMDRLWTSNLRHILKLAGDVIAQKDAGRDVSRYWTQLSVVLNEVPEQAHDALQRVRARVVFPSPDLETKDFVIADERFFAQIAENDDIYSTFIAFFDVAAEFGIDTSRDREHVVSTLTDGAANRSIFLEVAQADIRMLRSAVATLPGNADLTDWLNAAEARVNYSAKAMQSIVNIMTVMELDSRQYRQQILTATGEITTDALDVGIVTNLLAEWGSKLTALLMKDGLTLVFRALLIFGIIFIFLKLAKLAQRMADHALGSARFRVSSLLRRMVVSSVRNIVILIGVLIALSQVGISLAPLLAGLGILGFIVGFALQDSLANFASGMLILLYRPFDVGDVVDVAGVNGKVSSMSLVNTTFMTFDNKRLVVPNNMIWGSVITNLTAQVTRRVDLVFGISYQDDIEKAERILHEVVNEQEFVLDNPEPLIKVH